MRAAFLAAVTAAVVGLGAAAQEHILTFRFEPETAQVGAGSKTSFRMAIDNRSPYEADDVDITLAPPEGLSIEPAHAVRARVRPLGKTQVTFTLRAVSALPAGSQSIPLEVLYTYCIDTKKDSDCYQILEEFTLPVTVAEAGQSTAQPGRHAPWGIILPVIGAGALAGAIAVRRLTGLSLPLYGTLVLLIAGALTSGVLLHQPRQAQGIAAVLCTSCVGIEEARREPPRLSTAAEAALGNLTQKRELLVFYAPWCPSCPYAEAMVKEMAAATDHLSYRFANVDEERELARSYGVVTSGRTIVPAIVRLDTGEVLFGAQDLEARLLRLLEGTP